jgi:hypothetical protein
MSSELKFQPPTDTWLAKHADDRLEAIAKDIETTHANAALHIAAQLAEARDIFRYRRDEGGFSGWVETRLHYSRSTAYNLLSIHERFGGDENLSKRLDTFPASILYLLAAPATPETAKTEVIARAETGEVLPVAEVKRVIEKHKPAKKPSKKQLKRQRKRERKERESARIAELAQQREARLKKEKARAEETATKLIACDLHHEVLHFLRSSPWLLKDALDAGVAGGNGADPAATAEAMKAEFAKLDDGQQP